jgi:transcriptional/translational regulatory protein YebC/TACO1
VQARLQASGVTVIESEPTYIPKSTVHVSGEPSATLLRLLEALEDLDDIQKVAANFEMDADEMATA